MATRSRRTTVTPAPNDIVDLTADDSEDVSTASEDSPPPSPRVSNPPSREQSRPARVASWRHAAHQHRRRNELEELRAGTVDFRRREDAEVAQRRHSSHSQQPQAEQRQQMNPPRAPPFGHRGPERSVIVLSDEDESGFEGDDFASDLETTDSDSVASITSLEVQFIEERRIPQPQRPQAEMAHDVAQIGRGPFGVPIPDLLRRGQQLMGWMAPPVPDYNVDAWNRMDGAPRGRQATEAGAMNVTMDYGRAAFAMGFDPFDRSSETPQVVQQPYKAPPPAKEGFRRTFGEEDVILCPMCGDELAIGKSDAKQQVWVVRQCGHVSVSLIELVMMANIYQVYCGECATNRALKGRTTKKSKGKEIERNLESTRSQPFQICQVEKCTSKVVAKTTMFPIYL